MEKDTIKTLLNICKDIEENKLNSISNYCKRKESNSNPDAYDGAISLIVGDIRRINKCIEQLNEELLK